MNSPLSVTINLSGLVTSLSSAKSLVSAVVPTVGQIQHYQYFIIAITVVIPLVVGSTNTFVKYFVVGIVGYSYTNSAFVTRKSVDHLTDNSASVGKNLYIWIAGMLPR